MGEKSNIGWTDSTVNFWSGCTKVSAGCKNCYAETLSKRDLGTIGKWGKGAKRQLHESAFTLAHRLNRKPWICDGCGDSYEAAAIDIETIEDYECSCGSHSVHRRRIFSLSLGDWLDGEVPIAWLARMLDTIFRCDKVIWILVTKRPEKWRANLEAALMFMIANASKFPGSIDFVAFWLNGQSVPENVWVMTSVEDQPSADARVPELLKIPAACRGLSMEPLLGPVKLNLATRCDTGNCQHHTDAECPGNAGLCVMQQHLDWLIAGGESGPGARPCHINWIKSIAEQGKAAGVAVFVKQLGSNPVSDGTGTYGTPPGDDLVSLRLKDRKGGDPDEWHPSLRVQQFPKTL